MITGISGFVGRYLANELRSRGTEIYGLDRKPMKGSTGTSEVYVEDLVTSTDLGERIREAEPDHIYHLAALYGRVPYQELYSTNVTGTANLIEAIRTSDTAPLLFLASSSAVYGRTSGETGIPEDCPTSPNTPYGKTKVEQEKLVSRARLEFGLCAVIARTFNLIGPGLPPSLLPSKIARQIAMAEAEPEKGELVVGGLEGRRDYVDVRDATRAYADLMSAGGPDVVYNVCSGRSRSMREILNSLLIMSRVRLEIRQVPDEERATEVSVQVGDFRRLRELTGWTPSVPFDRSLRELLTDWREMLNPGEGSN